MLLAAEQLVLLLIDLQEGLLPVIAEADRIVENALVLMRLAGELAVPALVTTREAGALGAAIPPLLAGLPLGHAIEKQSFSAFGSHELHTLLAGWPQRRQLLVCGVESHVCVVRTVLGARRRGYEVAVAEDAVGSIADENRRRGLRRMARAGATLLTTGQVLRDLHLSARGTSRTDASRSPTDRGRDR